MERNHKAKMRKKKLCNKVHFIKEELYMRSFTMPYLRCLSEEEIEYALREIHNGVCVKQLGAKTIAYKLL